MTNCVYSSSADQATSMDSFQEWGKLQSLNVAMWLMEMERIDIYQWWLYKMAAVDALVYLNLIDMKEAEEEEEERKRRRFNIKQEYITKMGRKLWQFEKEVENQFKSNRAKFGLDIAIEIREISLTSRTGQDWLKMRRSMKIQDEPQDHDCFIQPWDLPPPLTSS